MVRQHAREVECVETEEEGILLDVDLPSDYEAVKERWKSPTETSEEPPAEPS